MSDTALNRKIGGLDVEALVITHAHDHHEVSIVGDYNAKKEKVKSCEPKIKDKPRTYVIDRGETLASERTKIMSRVVLRESVNNQKCRITSAEELWVKKKAINKPGKVITSRLGFEDHKPVVGESKILAAIASDYM